MLFEIFPEDVSCQPRTIKGKDGKPDRVLYDQKVFWIKGRQIIELTLTHNEITNAYSAGQYDIDDDSFEFESFYGRGQLKFNPYNFKLKPISDLKSNKKF